MTVNPGFGHQHFLRSALPKIERVRNMVEHANARCEVDVDGALMRRLRHWLARRAPTSLSLDRRFLEIVREWSRP